MISIIIPIYNVEDYLNKCIDSIIYQTYSDWELILVDDGSFDSSPAICDSYATCDSRIRVIHKINEGVSKARNIGIEIAQGEYIVFCDADDYVDPNYLKQFLKNNKNADLVITGYYFDTNNIVYSYKIYQEAYCKNLEEIKKHFFLQNLKSNGYPWGKFYKHEIIKSNHLRFNEHLQINEDHLFVFQYLLCCKTIYITPSKDYHYTVFRGNNIKLSSKRNPFHMHKLASECFKKEINRMQTFWKLTSIEYNSLINEFVYSKRLLGLNSLCIQKDVTSFKEEIFYWKTRKYHPKNSFHKIILFIICTDILSTNIKFAFLRYIYALKEYNKKKKYIQYIYKSVNNCSTQIIK